MPRVVLHIGAHKTGTTYLQHVFRTFQSNDVEFPACWSQSEDQPGHRKLFDALTAGATDSIRAVLAGIGAEVILISSEDFSTLQDDRLRALRAVFGHAPVSIVFYCRRWSEVLPAIWQERVKHGFSETLPQFLAAVMASPVSLDFVDFSRILDRYANVFGKDSIRIVSYSAVTDAGQDLAAHFADTLEPQCRPMVDNAGSVLGSRPNRSLPPSDIEIVRALNAMHVANGGERGPAAREWFLREGHAFGAAPPLDAIRLSDEHPDLRRLHGQLWSTWGHRVVEPHPDGRFFEPRTREILYAPPVRLPETLYRAFLASTE